jgi:low affinity Fe/Cu permease
MARRRRGGTGGVAAARPGTKVSFGSFTAFFSRVSKWADRVTGHAATFSVAVLVLLVWLITGPVFRWSDTWQLVINTATSVITFLMVFLIQNSQNRKSDALQIKLDELIRSLRGAHNKLLDLEEWSEAEMEQAKEKYTHLAERSRLRGVARNGARETGHAAAKKAARS